MTTPQQCHLKLSRSVQTSPNFPENLSSSKKVAILSSWDKPFSMRNQAWICLWSQIQEQLCIPRVDSHLLCFWTRRPGSFRTSHSWLRWKVRCLIQAATRLGSLQQVGSEEVLGSVYTTWGWSIWTLWLLINAPHCTLALHIEMAPNWTELFPFKEGCEGLCWRWGFCVDVFLLLRCSPECCQRCGLSQWKGEFPSLMSLHLFLHLTWPRWKAWEPSQLFVFPFLSIFQPLPFICTSL